MSDQQTAVDEFLPFRQAALETTSARFGYPLRTYSVGGWRMIALAAAVFAVLGLLLLTSSYSRKSKAEGMLVPAAGVLDVVAPRAGIISQVFVREGDLVKAGTPIFSLSLDEEVQGGRVAALLDAATTLQAQAADTEAAARLEQLTRQREDIRVRGGGLGEKAGMLAEQEALVRRQVESAANTVERMRPAMEKGYVSQVRYQAWEDGLIQARLSLNNVLQQRQDNREAARQLALEERRLDAEVAQAQAQAQAGRAALAEKRANLQNQAGVIVTAAKPGRVTAIQGRRGAYVNGGRSVAVILPTGSELVAELWLKSSDIGFVEKGQAVRLMYDSFPYQQFGMPTGRVVSVSSAPVASADLPGAPQGERLYPVQVRLERQTVAGTGGPRRLLAGMKLSAIIVLEKRNLMAWILEPLTAARLRRSV